MNETERIVEEAIRSLDRSLRDVVPPLYAKQKRRIYISGPMTGLPDLNRAEFERVEKLLDGDGLNPHKLPHNHGKTHAEFMKEDLATLLRCDGVIMLKGWTLSEGAQLEHTVAVACGIPVYYDP